MVCFPSPVFFLYVKEQNIILQSLKKVVLHILYILYRVLAFPFFFSFCCFPFQLVKAYDERQRERRKEGGGGGMELV